MALQTEGRAASADRVLARMERDAVIACLVMAVAALALRGGRLDAALGVLGGGALAALSYLAIKGAVDVIVRAIARAAGSAVVGEPGGPGTAPTTESADPGGGAVEGGAVEPPPARRPLRRRQRVLVFVNFFVRYALLAVGAYVMLMRLRLHPVGMLAGVSVPVVAVAAELARSWRGRR